MIFTSYYGKMKSFPDSLIPISISQGIPKWYTGLTMKKLAPSWDILMEYKNSTLSEEEKEERYNERYKKEILGSLDANDIYAEIERLLPTGCHAVLLCYEKDGDFCHRSLVKQWFKEHGLACKEFSGNYVIDILDEFSQIGEER